MSRSTPPLAALTALLLLAGATAPARAEEKWARHWRERVEAFRAENEKLSQDGYAVFVGDSITEGMPLERLFPGKPVLNRGIVADTTGAVGERGVVRRLDESVFRCRPAVVFLLIGVNDLSSSNRPPATFVGGVREILDRIRERVPDLKVVLQTCLPAGRNYSRHGTLNPRIEAFNEGLRALAKERKLPLVDLHAAYRGPDGLLPDDLTNDGLHLKRDAYERWAALVRPHLP